MKTISIVTPCYNEEGNIREVYKQVKSQFLQLSNYEYEHIFIDNASNDKTVDILRSIAKEDKNVKLILNAKNFGPIRSPYYGFLQAKGDAVMLIVADLQDPIELIPDFIKRWEEGIKVVIGIKSKSKESHIVYALRKIYYKIIKEISETEHISNFTGFGLYDQSFVELLRNIEDPYPYFRGLVAELGCDIGTVEYTQAKRYKGITSYNLYSYYNYAMLGFVNQSKVPLRLACFIGFAVAILSLLAAFGYFVYKLLFWQEFSLGTAPIVIGLFFFSSVQLFFIGIIGEYVGAIHTQVRKRPLVIEKERVNF